MGNNRLSMALFLWSSCWNTNTSIQITKVIVNDEDCGSDVGKDYNVDYK